MDNTSLVLRDALLNRVEPLQKCKTEAFATIIIALNAPNSAFAVDKRPIHALN